MVEEEAPSMDAVEGMAEGVLESAVVVVVEEGQKMQTTAEDQKMQTTAVHTVVEAVHGTDNHGSSGDHKDDDQEDSIPARKVLVSWTPIYFVCDASVPGKEYRDLEKAGTR
jgi:hypothetical protein